MLEVGELLDCPLHALPAHGLKDAEKTGDVLVPCSDLTHKVRHGTLGPKPTLIIHFDLEAHSLGFIEQSDHREMAPQKILDAAAHGIAAVLSFAEGFPEPAAQPGANAPGQANLDERRIAAQSEPSRLAALAQQRLKPD